MQAPYAASATRYDNSNNYHNSSISKHLPSISMQMVFSYATCGVGRGKGEGKQIYDTNGKSLSMLLLPFFAIFSMRNGNFYAMIKPAEEIYGGNNCTD